MPEVAGPEVAGNAGILVNPTAIRSIREGLEARQLTMRSMLVFRGMQDRMLLASIGLQVRQLETVFEKTIAKRRRIH
ncbi:MAG: hypothetical protein QM684_10945 [Rhizobium sp.]